jgi:ABC-type transport system substrate-binding protein
LLHGIDRQSLIDQQFSGFAEVAHGWLPPQDPDYGMIADAITRYDLDLTRAQRLLTEAGWQKGGDGVLVNASSQRFDVEYRAFGRDQRTTATILADEWKRIGVAAQLAFIPEARVRDHEFMGKFPGIRAHAMVGAPVGGASSRFTCDRVPGPQNSWLSHTSNPAGYCTPEMERQVEAMDGAFPFSARMGPFKEMMRIALREVPYLPLYFEAEPIAVRSNVLGVNRVPPKDRGRIGMHSYTWVLE